MGLFELVPSLERCQAVHELGLLLLFSDSATFCCFAVPLCVLTPSQSCGGLYLCCAGWYFLFSLFWERVIAEMLTLASWILCEDEWQQY